MKNKSLKKNALLSGFQKLFSIIFPLITFPYVTRILFVDTLGKINFAKSIVSYFVLLSALGINNYSIREGSQIRDNKEKINDFCSKMFSLNIVVTIISYLLFFILIFIWKGSSNYFVFLLVESLTILGSTIGINWLYSIFEEYKYIAIRTIAFQFISLICLLFFVKSSDDGVIYLWITVLSAVGSNFLNLIHSRKFVNLKFTLKLDLKKHLKPIMIIFASSLAVSIYVNSDVTILGWLKGDYAVGLYSVSVRIYTIIKQLVASMVVVTLPRVSEYLGKKEYKKYNDIINRVFNFVFTFSIPVGVGMACVSKDIIFILSSTKYYGAILSLIILSISLIFSVFSSFVTYAIILPCKKDMIQLKATIISAIINILLNLIMIPILSLNGAAMTTVLAELLVFVIEVLLFFKSKESKNHKDILKLNMSTIMSTIIGCILIVLVSWIFRLLRLNIIIHFILTIIVSVFLYLLVCILLKNDTIKILKIR